HVCCSRSSAALLLLRSLPSPSLLLSLLVSNHPRVHHDLRSFPTRRSSDLYRPRELPARARHPAAMDWRRDRGDRRAPDGGGSARSEEHTSELQSRENLVCRLLLEKKKTED